jgi:hypothetical protein
MKVSRRQVLAGIGVATASAALPDIRRIENLRGWTAQIGGDLAIELAPIHRVCWRSPSVDHLIEIGRRIGAEKRIVCALRHRAAEARA